MDYKFNVIKTDPDIISLTALETILFKSMLVRGTTH